MNKKITPTFPTQQSITNAVQCLSESDKARYKQLLEKYKRETRAAENINHEKIAALIREAQELLSEH